MSESEMQIIVYKKHLFCILLMCKEWFYNHRIQNITSLPELMKCLQMCVSIQNYNSYNNSHTN